ncbi:MAG: rod shape-determining protein MreC [Firmicutes bacterium]|nr:rod shape-determining protein MreC [Bacillota bacterium]
MLKKYGFYIFLITIYLFVLGKDTFIGLFKAKETNNFCTYNNLDYKLEYEDLSELLNIKIDNYNLIYSKIIIRDIYDFYNKVTINKGLNDNIKKGNIVINSLGLIGVIDKVYKNYSEVKLITNKDINISVKINNSYGILYSKDNKLYVNNIKLDNEIKVGDIVSTSGLTDIPGNIKIGTVTKVNRDSLELEYILDINTYNNFNNIKYVGVIV